MDFIGFNYKIMVVIIIVLLLRALMILSQKFVSKHADTLFYDIGQDKDKINNFVSWLIVTDTLIALDPYLMLVTLFIITIYHVKLRSIEIQLIGNEASHTEHLIQKEDFTRNFQKIMIAATTLTQAALPIVSIVLFANFND